MSPNYDIDQWRKQFPLLKTHIHVANCSQSPQSKATRAAAFTYLDSWNRHGMDWDLWLAEVNHAKCEFARLINASPSEIAIGTSLSELTSAVASSLTFHGSRNKIILTEAEFPSIGQVWLANQKYGAELDYVPVRDGEIKIEDYRRVVDKTTLLTSICDVYYYNGFKQNLEDIIPIVHEQGSLLYVDAYQGIGTHSIDVKALDIDLLASGNLKYLLGVPGVAFLYVKQDILQKLKPAFTGWFGQENPFAFDVHRLEYAGEARRFDSGTPPILAAYIARAGMQIINQVGVLNIQVWTETLSQHCIDGATSRGLEVVGPRQAHRTSPTTAIRIAGDSHAVQQALARKKIIASARSDVIRIAPHFFTRLDEIDTVLDCLSDILR